MQISTVSVIQIPCDREEEPASGIKRVQIGRAWTAIVGVECFSVLEGGRRAHRSGKAGIQALLAGRGNQGLQPGPGRPGVHDQCRASRRCSAPGRSQELCGQILILRRHLCGRQPDANYCCGTPNCATKSPAAASSRSSAAPPRSRKKSSPAASACSLTRSFTKSVLPDSDTKLDKTLELAVLRKSMSGSAGPCSPELLSCGHRAVKAGSTGIGVGGRQHAE